MQSLLFVLIDPLQLVTLLLLPRKISLSLVPLIFGLGNHVVSIFELIVEAPDFALHLLIRLSYLASLAE